MINSRLVLLLFLLFIISNITQAKEPVYVSRVVDGDTIEVINNEAKYKVRLIGIDTPETKHPKKGIEYYRQEASDFTKNALEGRTVYLEFDVGKQDRYKRLLAYVWLDEEETDVRKMFNSILLLEGYSQIMTVPPNVKYVEYFKEYQREARELNRGLWAKEKGQA